MIALKSRNWITNIKSPNDNQASIKLATSLRGNFSLYTIFLSPNHLHQLDILNWFVKIILRVFFVEQETFGWGRSWMRLMIFSSYLMCGYEICMKILITQLQKVRKEWFLATENNQNLVFPYFGIYNNYFMILCLFTNYGWVSWFIPHSPAPTLPFTRRCLH